MRWTLAGLLLALTAVPAKAQSTYELPIEEHMFDNGLRLLVLERPGDHRVACKIFTRMGAINEAPGNLGAAHFLEHLMFKGTRTLGTTDWAAEAPIRERLNATEAELVEALNAARNEIRQRGVFHDYRHAGSTPRIDSLRGQIAELEEEASAYRDNGAMMRWYQAFGGTGLTATTEQEYMKFDINLPAERVELFLRVEADRMRNTVFREFDEEVMILVEQRYGDLNRLTTPFHEAMDATVSSVHPVFWPEGYLTDFPEYTRRYQRRLYETYFVPNNTTLVLIGGVTLEEMIPMVERYFGAMERAPEPQRASVVEPVPHAERRMVWRSDRLGPRVDIRHMIPAIGHPDRPHFDVLAEVAQMQLQDALDAAGVRGSASANTRVVHTERFGVPATLNLEVVLDREEDLEAAERQAMVLLRRLAVGEVPAATLELAKKRLRTRWYRTARNPDALAFEIGHFQTMDRWQTLPEHLKARESTTATEIRRLATRYFVPENRTVGVVRRAAGASAAGEGE